MRQFEMCLNECPIMILLCTVVSIYVAISFHVLICIVNVVSLVINQQMKDTTWYHISQ